MISIAPSPRPRESDWKLFLRLVPYARKSGRLLAISLALLVPLAIAGAVQPIIVGQAISLIRGESTLSWLVDRSLQDGLNLLSLTLLITILIRLAFRGVQGYLVQEVGQQITAAIRNDLFDHVTALAVRFYDRTPVGKLITRLTSDVEALGDVFSTGAIGIVSDILSLIIVLVAMFSLQWQLASILVILLVPITALMLYFQQQYRKANYKAREELSQLNASLQENILGIGVVQIFRRERFNAEQFRVTNQRYMEAVDKTIFHDSAISATLEWVSLVAIGAVLWLGAWLVEGDSLALGTLASFILFSQRVFDPLRQLAEKFTAIQSGLTAVERVADLLNEPIEIQDPHQKQCIVPSTEASDSVIGGEIRFEQVSLAYKPGEYVLHDLNFTIKPGEKVALVGPTGAGKTSIIRLLCRLYEATEGRVVIDGVNVRDLAQGELRRYLGVILQDGFVFAGDVKGNISLGESYDREMIQAAARSMNVDRFIEDLPQGYDTELRQRGTNLSAGQKQLLAFARVAVRNPQILILDEATSNLDVGTESWVQEALDRLLVNRTAIIVAHRLSTIRKVDRILVLKQGRLVESGSHDQLLAQGGLYASLYKLQMLGQ